MDRGNTFRERWRKNYWCGTVEHAYSLLREEENLCIVDAYDDDIMMSKS